MGNFYNYINNYMASRADNSHAAAFLHIGAVETVLVLMSAGAESGEWVLPIGSSATAVKHYTHFPPSEAEIESSILDVEYCIMPLAAHIARGTRLVTFDAEAGEIARLAFHPDGVLPAQDMENLFSRLSAIVAGGRPASSDNLPMSAEFAVRLLILRETMHHLGFDSITIADKA